MKYWIYKGTSNHCSELVYDVDTDQLVKNTPEGFYDLVSLSDTIEGGIPVIEYATFENMRQEYLAVLKENGKLLQEITLTKQACYGFEAELFVKEKQLEIAKRQRNFYLKKFYDEYGSEIEERMAQYKKDDKSIFNLEENWTFLPEPFHDPKDYE